jgi:tRNA(Ile2) C34 agmatinyltransferase TiaS
MKTLGRTIALSAAVALAGCAQTGTLGDILGGVLNAPSQTLSGTIQDVDTRTQQIFVRTSNNQTVAVSYDERTDVVYQQQNYPVTSLEDGDQVNMRLAETSNGRYYTDRIDVTASGSGTNSGDAQLVQGTVRNIDYNNGAFTLATSNQGTLTVTLPYNPRSSDVDRFRSLRSGDYVRLYGTYLSSTRVELRQFN